MKGLDSRAKAPKSNTTATSGTKRPSAAAESAPATLKALENVVLDRVEADEKKAAASEKEKAVAKAKKQVSPCSAQAGSYCLSCGQ